ncbi:MAG: SGNH/GDSL hydrolase family protein [Alistipes sp.]|nr:SGNH/GDSL hydrolase family protein [Candidatus Alistipes equi]
MKKNFAIVLFLFSFILLSVNAAEKKEIIYTDAQQLTFLGKMCKTENPYHRVEVSKYDELTNTEKNLLIEASGEMVAFSTDAPEIWVKAEYGRISYNRAMPATAGAGFNLYIKKDGEWLYAASKVNKDGKDKNGNKNLEKPLRLIANMAKTEKECLLYLPLYAELKSLEIGVPKGYALNASKNPFRHNIAIFGSSYTHGSCSSAAGMTYPAFLSRQTGLYLCSFGMSGNSKLQRVMGEILAGTNADAYICDAFSNPSIAQIGERIRPFIDEIRKVNQKAPIIFLRTIFREGRLFDLKAEKKEQDRMEFVDALMKDIVKEYKDVYYVDVPDQTGTDHLTSADGVHPFSWGYKRWADAIQPRIVEILAQYGIK